MIARLWTIGHSTRSIEEFIGALVAHEIKAIADVRLLPGSKRYPQFNQDMLRHSLAASDISYEHFPELGGRRRPRVDSRHTAWRNDAFRGYADYTETDAFRGGIARLTELSQKHGAVAIMCAEAVWWRCHRALISDYLKIRGVDVLHILDAKKCQPHPYTSAARIIDGELSYGANQSDPSSGLRGLG